MEQKIKTPLTEFFGIRHPIMLAPMDQIAGGRLAAAVSKAGGFGIIGGGYGNREWLEDQIQLSHSLSNSPEALENIGIGFITWSLLKQPDLIDFTLAQAPRALMVSFGDGEPIIDRAKTAGIPTIWQVQRVAMAEQAMNAGADIIVVQGQEGGGHGMDRGLISLLPAVRDAVGSDQILVAAGGISDGRGLTAALNLGADGVMLGTRLWASEEANGSGQAKQRLVDSKGDDTVRSKVFDVARGVDWPWHFTGRVVENDFLKQWHGNTDALKQQAEQERLRYLDSDPNDFSIRVSIAGECLDNIHSIKPAAAIIEEMVAESVKLLKQGGRFLL